MHDLIQPMIDGMKARGIAEESEGALVVRVAEPDDKQEVPPLILTKSDGAVMYGTTDLATIVDRVRSHDPDLILYVVDQRQHLHFEQVFRAARRAGLNWPRAAGASRLRHHERAGRQAVQDPRRRRDEAAGPDRDGDRGGDEAAGRSRASRPTIRRPSASRSPRRSASPRSSSPTSPTTGYRTTSSISSASRASRARPAPTFNMRRCASNRCCARRRSRAMHPAACCRRPTSSGRWPCCSDDCPMPWRPPTVGARRTSSASSRSALAQEFSRFYSACHILSETDAGLRASRLRLAQLTLRELELILSLLGIEVPERM